MPLLPQIQPSEQIIVIDEKKEAYFNEMLSRPMEYEYFMRNKKRGKALIFNHKFFDDPNTKARYGTEADAVRLQITFRKLGFEVRIFDDRTLDQIRQILKECELSMTKFCIQNWTLC